MLRVLSLVVVFALAGCSTFQNTIDTYPPHAIQILYIGHPDLADSEARATTLGQHIGPQGMHITYAKDLYTAQAMNLAAFTGMLLHINLDEDPTPSPPDALMPYLSRGAAFVFDADATPEALTGAILRGLNQSTKKQWTAGKPEALRYATPEAPIPVYEDNSDVPLKQFPLPPEQSLAYTQVPIGFEAKLFAAEPDVVNPVAMAWDEKGRLWVIETLDYPNNKRPLGEGNDKVKILEDTDGDGRVDNVIVFAEGLSIATGFTFINDGIIVSAPPEMLYLKDTDGDDVADVQEVLFDGFLTFDTHAGVSNLRYGFDNWIWMAIGYAGFEGTVGNEEHRFKQGLFRLKPDLSKLDYLSHFSNNTWGLGFSENGDVFSSTANNEHSVYLAIADRYFAGVNGFDKSGYASIAPYKKFHPITDKVRQVDVFGGYTAATGHALYTARQFPEEYWNRAAFVNEPTGHLVHQGFLRQEGTQFVMEDGWNVMASADEWAAPVMAEVGPDGALWVLDWYNLIIQHNPVPEGFVAGEGDAYETPLRDQEHGRIYRIVPKGSALTTPMTLSKAKPSQLVQALNHTNLFWRQTAQRLLVERGQKDVVDELLALLDDHSVDKAGINGGALHAIWTLHGLGALDGTIPTVTQQVVEALNHPATGVRRAAIQVLPTTADLWNAIIDAELLQDADPILILHTLLKLSELPPSEAIGQALYALQKQPGFAGDPWLPTALAIAAARHHTGYLAALMVDTKPDIQRNVIPVDLPNAGFEKASGDLPAGWSKEEFIWPLEETNPNTYTHAIVPGGRTGNALQISSPTGADVGIYKTVTVKPNTDYLLTGWIKTEDVENVGGGYGAVIDILTFGRTRTIRGTSDWTWVEKRINTGSKTEIRIQCHLGRWGQYKGTAWFDDLRLVELGKISPAAVVAETVLRHIGAGGLEDAALAVLNQFDEAAPTIRDLALTTFAENWPTGQRPAAATSDDEFRAAMDFLSDSQQAKLEALLNRWAGESVEDDKPAGIQQLLLQTEVNTLRFVQDTLVVKAGSLVELTLENIDAMPHNVVIGQPGSLEAIGSAADALATATDGQARAYVPDLPSIIASSSLVDGGDTTVITFQAPTTPGEYPFVCTFPGHWRVMNGILKVIE